MAEFIHYDIDCDEKKISKHNKISYDTLVIGGGGLKGSQFVGALQALFEEGYLIQIQNYFGTSVGALICLLYILGFNPNQQYEILKHSKIFSFKKLTQVKYSFLNFELPKILKEYIDPKMTFSEFHEKTKKYFFVISFNCSRREECVFSVLDTPNFCVYDAICSSCTLPFAFDLPIVDDEIYMDGGIINNLPVDIACKQDFTKNIIAITCVENKKFNNEYNFGDILNLSINVPSRQLDVYRLELCKLKYVNKNIECIECKSDHGVSSILIMNAKEKENLFENGYNSVHAWLQKFCI